MKTTGVLPEALAASISRYSRSEIDGVAAFARSTCSSSVIVGETVAFISSSLSTPAVALWMPEWCRGSERRIVRLIDTRIRRDAGASRQSCVSAPGDPDRRTGGFEPVPASYLPGGVDLYLRWEANTTPPNPPYAGFIDCFANGVDREDAAVLFAMQRPAAVGKLGTRLQRRAAH